ncbi:hypothetical protein OG401_21000 [Kitasatospora purpeofusca]|uniref:hypothetical protein n=1 Tax=Kitasatospora purpeofusca TaxID=67352 RepID=UPI002251F5C7|nr:hypothetical protein [Kitasatospora purpeofusca]MCX4686759.1 hypothetical protein [Kitasatospora purpeofusca]
MATLEELQVAVSMDADGLGQDAERGASKVQSALGGIAAAGAGLAVGGAFAMALDSAMDISSITTAFENELGLTKEAAAEAGKSASAVFSSGFGESLEEVQKALVAVRGSLSDMAGASEADLQRVTKQALALSKTFEFDIGESSLAAGNLVKLGLVKSSEQAFDLMTVAAQNMGPKLREEIPMLTTEYAEFFHQLGFDGPAMFGLLTQAAKNPAFELDKLGDALKEFSLLMAEPDKVAQPLKDLGLNVKDIQKLINTGQGTAAFDQVTSALRGVEDQTKRTALQAALFGGPGEDMGANLLSLDAAGAAASGGLEDAAGAAQKITASMAASPAQQWDSVMRTLSTTLGQALAPAISWVSDLLQKNPELLSAITPVVLGLAAALAVWAAIQWALNSAMLANPMTWVVLGVVALVAAIVVIATKTSWFQDLWQGAMDGISAAWNWTWGILKAGWDLLVSLFLNWSAPGLIIKHWDVIKSAFSTAITWVSGVVQGGMNMIGGWFNALGAIPGKVASWFGDIGDKIASPFRAGFNNIARFWNSTIGGFSFSIPSWVPLVGGKSWSIPDIPMLAEGGIVPSTPGGMLALVGEGRQDEAVMPLDRLDGMLASVAGTARSGGDAGPARVVLDVTGTDGLWKKLITHMVRTTANGNVQKAFGG